VLIVILPLLLLFLFSCVCVPTVQQFFPLTGHCSCSNQGTLLMPPLSPHLARSTPLLCFRGRRSLAPGFFCTSRSECPVKCLPLLACLYRCSPLPFSAHIRWLNRPCSGLFSLGCSPVSSRSRPASQRVTTNPHTLQTLKSRQPSPRHRLAPSPPP